MIMLEIKNLVTAMKNIFDRLISKLDVVKEATKTVEYKSIIFTQTKKQGEKRVRKKYNKVWHNIKQSNLCVI